MCAVSRVTLSPSLRYSKLCTQPAVTANKDTSPNMIRSWIETLMSQPFLIERILDKIPGMQNYNLIKTPANSSALLTKDRFGKTKWDLELPNSDQHAQFPREFNTSRTGIHSSSMRKIQCRPKTEPRTSSKTHIIIPERHKKRTIKQGSSRISRNNLHIWLSEKYRHSCWRIIHRRMDCTYLRRSLDSTLTHRLLHRLCMLPYHLVLKTANGDLTINNGSRINSPVTQPSWCVAAYGLSPRTLDVLPRTQEDANFTRYNLRRQPELCRHCQLP